MRMSRHLGNHLCYIQTKSSTPILESYRGSSKYNGWYKVEKSEEVIGEELNENYLGYKSVTGEYDEINSAYFGFDLGSSGLYIKKFNISIPFWNGSWSNAGIKYNYALSTNGSNKNHYLCGVSIDNMQDISQTTYEFYRPPSIQYLSKNANPRETATGTWTYAPNTIILSGTLPTPVQINGQYVHLYIWPINYSQSVYHLRIGASATFYTK